MASFDDAITLIGGFGRYQKFLFFFCFTILTLSSVFTNTTIVFLTATPDHWCRVPQLDLLNLSQEETLNLTIPVINNQGKSSYSSCLQQDVNYLNWTRSQVEEVLSQPVRNVSSVECQSGWEYDRSIYRSTIVTEWDLVCDRKMWVATSKSVYLAGFLVGVLFFGLISDTFGRKKTYFATTVLYAIGSLLVSVSPNLTCFLIFRFLLGALNIGNYTIFYILVMELVTPPWRGFVNMFASYMWSFAAISVTGVAYAIRDWRYLALALGSPCVLQLVNLFFVPESPRWLYTQDKRVEADAIMKKIAKVNKKTYPEKLQVEIKEEQKGRLLDLFRFPRLRMRMIILCIQWFAVTMVYYGLAYSSADFGYGGNPYLNFLMGMLVEVPSAIFCHFSQRFVGRRTVLIGFDILGGAALLSILAIPKAYSGAYYLTLAFSLTGRLCATGVFIMVYLYTAEVLPTVVRSVGMGTASATARIGGILAQYLMGLKEVSLFIPYLTMGGMSILAGLLLIALPETKGRKLPETITEGEDFGRNSSGEVNQAFDNGPQEIHEERESTYI